VRIGYYIVGGTLSLAAIAVGFRLALATPGRLPRLPRWFLLISAGLLFAIAGISIPLLVSGLSPVTSIWGVIVGVVYGIAAVRLARHRRREHRREDGT
jgi:hypothetical protein